MQQTRHYHWENMMTVDKPGEASMQSDHRKRVLQIREDAVSLAGTAHKIVEAANQVLEQGGFFSIQGQMAFITGAHARMMKDIGVVEHLQNKGVSQKKRPPTK